MSDVDVAVAIIAAAKGIDWAPLMLSPRWNLPYEALLAELSSPVGTEGALLPDWETVEGLLYKDMPPSSEAHRRFEIAAIRHGIARD